MSPSEKFKRLTCTDAIRSDLRGRSVRTAAISGITSGGDFLIRIGSTAVLARLLLPEAFGLVMMVMAVTAIAEQLRELGLSAATVQRKDITHEQVSNLFWINTGVGALLTILVCACSPLIATYYREPRLIPITCALASNFIFGGLMVQHQALLTRQMKLGQTSAVRLGSSVLSTALAILLAWLGFGFWSLVWREISRAVLLTMGMWACLPWIPGLPSRSGDVRAMLGFGANLSVANIFSAMTAGVDRFLLGRLTGAGPVAIYRQAYQLIISPTDQLVGPLYNVAQPALCMIQTEHTRYARYYRKVLSLVCLITMPLSLFVAVYSTEVARVLLGPNWTDCGPILMILSLGTLIRQAAGSSAFVLITRGFSRKYLHITLCNNVLFVIAMIIGVNWGTIGAAIADTTVIWIMLLPRLFYSFKNSPVKVRDFFTAAARPFGASAFMAATLISLHHLLPSQAAPIALAFGSVAAPVLFTVGWLIIPGGRAALLNLMSDARSLVGKKRSTPSPAPAAVA